MTIGDRIRAEREAQRISRAELARAAGIAPSTLSDLELGASKSTTALHKIASRLGVRAEWLETGKGKKEAESPEPSQPARLDPEIVRTTHELLRGAYEDAGNEYDIEAEPDLFATVYERLAVLARKPTLAEVVSIGRAIGERQQGAVDGNKGSERPGITHSGKSKKRAAGQAPAESRHGQAAGNGRF